MQNPRQAQTRLKPLLTYSRRVNQTLGAGRRWAEVGCKDSARGSLSRRSKTGRVGCGCHEDRRPRRRWTDANSLSDSHSRLSYWSYRKSAVCEPPARRRRERCHEGSRWRPSPGSLAQPTTLRDRRPIVMSLSRTGAPLEVMFIDSKALLIAKGGKGTLDPHACNPRAAAHHCSARDTVAGPTPIAIHRRT